MDLSPGAVSNFEGEAEVIKPVCLYGPDDKILPSKYSLLDYVKWGQREQIKALILMPIIESLAQQSINPPLVFRDASPILDSRGNRILKADL